MCALSTEDSWIASTTETPCETAFSFMTKRKKYRVLHDDKDVTPYDIVDANYVTMQHDLTHAVFEPRQRRQISENYLVTDRSLMGIVGSHLCHSGLRMYRSLVNLDDIRIDHTIDTEHSQGANLGQDLYTDYLLRDNMAYPPEILVSLKETATVFLYDLPSSSYDRGTIDGAAIEKENENYEYITVGKGKNRKVGDQETQTKQKIFQSRHSLASRPKKKDQMSFASLWDMHDAYSHIARCEEAEPEEEMVLFHRAAPHLLRKKRFKETNKQEHSTWESIAELPQFSDAALICERVLAAKDYGKAQKTFRGLVSVDPLSKDLVYIYTMKQLWSFQCAVTAGRPVTSVSFNPMNSNILAVGHGKFGYDEKVTGIVCVWCTKNPCNPERLYHFENPVTSVSFSQKRPNWLAVAFSNGEICILDIASYKINIIAKSSRQTNPSFEPIWMTAWKEINKSQEYVITAGQDGRISKFINNKTHDFICTPMMRICAVDGKMKGLEVVGTSLRMDVPITRYPAALCIRWHPIVDHIYLVGSNEGCIHKCSTRYLNQHMDVFKAHAGPVYNMVFSPFMPQLLVTCGADNAIRIWIEGLDDVVMTLNCDAAVYNIAFCPVNATILISVSGNVLSVWDLRRKTHIPCTEYSFPGNVILTYVKFSPSGDNLFVGDTAGRVHTFHLQDTPIPPYYQREMLDDAIKKALCTRPLLLQQLEKLNMFKRKT